MLGVTIGEYHTFRAWGLRWCGVSISAPETNTRFIEVPGRNGALDLSEALTGFPTYKDRDIVLTFDGKTRDFDSWERLYSQILNAIHGQRLKIQLDTDPGFYYEGRVSVSSKKEVLETDTLTIAARVAPYKLELTSSRDPWLWDPFSFETGIIRDYDTLTVNGSLSLVIPGNAMRVVPTITTSAAMTVTFEGKTYNLTAGKNRVSDICLTSGENTLVFTGSGTVSVNYQGGEL